MREPISFTPKDYFILFRSTLRSCIPPTNEKRRIYKEANQLRRYLMSDAKMLIQFECMKEYAIDQLDPEGNQLDSEGKHRKPPLILRFGNKLYDFFTRKWDRGESENITFDDANRICKEQYKFHLPTIQKKEEI